MSAPLRVGFLTEGGPGVGLGHLRRCQALASTLRARDARVRFLVAGDAGAAGADQEHLDWRRDPEQALSALRRWRPDAVVVDSYRAGPHLLEEVAAIVPCAVAVDDLADRRLPVHVVVNGSWHAARLRYTARPDTIFLLGPEYALLDPAFAEPPRRPPRDDVRRVLVTLGGDPPAGALDAVVSAVRRAAPTAVIDLALGPFTPTPAGPARGLAVHWGLHSLRDLMWEVDFAVTGGGMTLYECLAAGTPVVGVCLADNQRPNIDELSHAGLILGGEPSLEKAVARLAGDSELRQSLSARGRAVVDGRGAVRVADAVGRVCVNAVGARSAR